MNTSDLHLIIRPTGVRTAPNHPTNRHVLHLIIRPIGVRTAPYHPINKGSYPRRPCRLRGTRTPPWRRSGPGAWPRHAPCIRRCSSARPGSRHSAATPPLTWRRAGVRGGMPDRTSTNAAAAYRANAPWHRHHNPAQTGKANEAQTHVRA